MGQIVRKRKNGRPSKADLAGRHCTPASPHPSSSEKPHLRRSNRRRSFRYSIIDYEDDYLDDDDDFKVEDDEDEEDDDQRRKEKKLKLVLKLHNTAAAASTTNHSNRPSHGNGDESVSWTRMPSRNPAGLEEEEEEEVDEDGEVEDEVEDGSRVVKKRKISGNEVDDEEDNEVPYNDEGRMRKGLQKKDDCVPAGTPVDTRPMTPLPEKKRLELILDKLQKKDTYGVYTEPVDPEELPDYHDVIDHPMDFSTIRKKLANGSYSTLEEFESDVFLICSNAMQYNDPETIYHKQAHAIKELSEKKFQRLRDDIEWGEKEKKPEQLQNKLKIEQTPKSGQQTKSNLSVTKHTKRLMYRNTQEPIGSDFPTGVTLATDDPRKSSDSVQVHNGERHSNHGGLLEGNSSLADDSGEKDEELQSEKDLLPKFGQKPFAVDENRRATYDASNQLVDSPESIFTTFYDEKKQLVSVGLQGEHSYARSLACFAATLGPVAWKFASKRIEQALPPGFKFGRGWIGEYEPPPTTLLFLDTRTQKDPFCRKLHSAAESKNDEFPQNSLPANGPNLEVKPTLVRAGGSKPPTPKSAVKKQRSALSRDYIPLENKPVKRMESNSPAMENRNVDHSAAMENRNADHGAPKLPEMTTRPVETVPRNTNSLQQLPFKQPDSNGFVVPGGLCNGKASNSSLDINQVILSPRSISQAQVVGVASLPHRQEQGLSDVVQVVRTSSEQVQKPERGLNPSLSPLQVRPSSVPSPRGDNRSNAAAAAASVWMSVGAGGFKSGAEKPNIDRSQISAVSLYTTSRDLYHQMLQSHGEIAVSGTVHVPTENRDLPFQAFVPQGPQPQPDKFTNDMQFQRRHIMLPQLQVSDMSRFLVQSPWRGLSPHTQQKQKPDRLPPDLNIAFQSPVDSQQPDLALQL
ncbi:hypothetical protein Dimus_012477 [Dionaea muscipula]